MRLNRVMESLPAAPARGVNWRGRSGRFYALSPDRIESFALNARDLHLVVHGDRVGWVGSEADLIHDQASRARFMLAMHGATAIYHIAAPAGDLERMTMTWDLDGAAPVGTLSAA